MRIIISVHVQIATLGSMMILSSMLISGLNGFVFDSSSRQVGRFSSSFWTKDLVCPQQEGPHRSPIYIYNKKLQFAASDESRRSHRMANERRRSRTKLHQHNDNIIHEHIHEHIANNVDDNIDDRDDLSDDEKKTIPEHFHSLDNILERKTRRMEWLLRTTSQIINLHNDGSDDVSDDDSDDDSTYDQNEDFQSTYVAQQERKRTNYPRGKLPSTLIAKIPTLMNIWMKQCSSDNSYAAFVVERLLQRLVDERREGNEYFATSSKNLQNGGGKDEKMITTDLYNIVIEAWTRTSGQFVPNDDQSAINLGSNSRSNWYTFDQTDRSKSQESTRGWKKSNQNNNMMILLEVPYPNTTDKKTSKTVPFAPTRAHDILNKMEDMAYHENIGDWNVRPDTKTYSLVLRAWVRSREYCSLVKMEEILDRLEEIGSNNDNPKYHDVQPTVQCFNLYLYALANSQDTRKNKKLHAKKAHAILLDLQRRYKNDSIKNGNLMPDVNTYNQVISAFAKTQCTQSAAKAQGILDNMMKEANVTNIYPDTNTFNAVMSCWHKSGSKKASHQIEYILNLMNEFSESIVGYHGARPDHYSINTAIASIAKSNRKEKLRMINYLLSHMEELYKVKPNTLSYNLVIDAYGKSEDLRAVNETERLLSTMEEMFIAGNQHVMPDSFSYSTVIDTLTSRLRSSAGEKAEMIVRRMELLCKEHGGKQPSTAVYNALMNCYASQGDRSDLHRLESILRFLEGRSQKNMPHPKPNIISYNTILKGYSQSKENLTRKAETLLERMESRNLKVHPDVVSYTTVITAFARSTMPGKARNAKRILDKMIESYTSGNNTALKLTIFPFNACLNACAFTFNRAEKLNAFIVAVDTLVLIQKYSIPDHITYGTVLKVWRNLIPKYDDRRQSVVRSSFQQCCEDGQVGSMVLRQLQLAASADLYQELVGSYIKDGFDSLPQKWSRNVREGRIC